MVDCMWSNGIKGIVRKPWRKLRSLRRRTHTNLVRCDLERKQWLSSEELNQVQWRRLKRLLRHAYKNVPFYRKRFDEVGLKPHDIRTMDDFRKIPILKKSDIQQNLNDLIATNYNTNQLKRDATGGSTGQPISFYRDQNASLWLSEAFKRFRRWIGYQPGDKLALIWGADRDFPSSPTPNQRWLNSFHWSPEQIEAFVEELVQWQPKAIRAYGSSLFLVASYIKNHQLKAPRPQGIESSAEKIWDFQRAVVEDVFGCKVFDQYGSREIPVIACECELHTGLHVFSDIRLVEIIRDGVPAKPGEEGSIIITDLLNEGMPLIRYQIGDVGVMSEEHCPCGRGFPLLKEITGRVTNTITTPDGKYVHGEYFTHLFYHVPGVKAFQVRQRSIDDIEVLVQPGAGFEETSIEALVAEMRSHLGADVNVHWKTVSEIPLAPSGKRHFTISDVPINFTSPGEQR